jgi:carbon-monoxide dehydrogenase large subunit
MDSGIPRADTMPTIGVDFSRVPSTTNPLGAKGVGEGGTVASTPTVMNAILHALAPLGLTDVPMPATPRAHLTRLPRARSGVSRPPRSINFRDALE